LVKPIGPAPPAGWAVGAVVTAHIWPSAKSRAGRPEAEALQSIPADPFIPPMPAHNAVLLKNSSFLIMPTLQRFAERVDLL
jgi:hypothetical protein